MQINKNTPIALFYPMRAVKKLETRNEHIKQISFTFFSQKAMQPDLHSRQGFSIHTMFSQCSLFYPLPVCIGVVWWYQNSLHHFVIHSWKISLVT